MTAMKPSPAVLAAFMRWRRAEAAAHYSQPSPDEVMDAFTDEASRAIQDLAAVPADNAADVLLKLLPLALIQCEQPIGQPPFVPVVQAPNGPNDEDSALWRGIIADLAIVSPVLAETMSLPRCEYAVRRAQELEEGNRA